MVARVHEADDRDASPRVVFQMLQQLARVSPGTDENDPALRAFPSRLAVLGFRRVQGIDHELPPIRRSIVPTIRPTRTSTRGGGSGLSCIAAPSLASAFCRASVQLFHRPYRRSIPEILRNISIDMRSPRQEPRI